MINTLIDLVPALRIADVIDVALVAVLLFFLLLALKQTRTTFVVVGLGILASFYIVAVSLDLRLTRFVYQLLFTVALVGLIVIFHDEIRVSIERFLGWQFRWRRGSGRVDPVPRELIDALIGTVTDFARERNGALIVLRGHDDPTRFLRSGYPLDGMVSEAVLKSIFDRHSLGHDGAVVVSGRRITQFGSHLPLSGNASQIAKRGTRHAAGLGISEKTDCLCLVVSEARDRVGGAARTSGGGA